MRLSLRFFYLLTLLVIAACKPTGDAMSDTQKIDWDSLTFACKKEVQSPLNREAQVWYRRARDLQDQDEDKNIKYIVELFEKAIERDHYNAMQRLALLYVYGAEGFPQNHRKAADLVERVIKLNVASGYYQMGVFLEQGIGVKEDPKAALIYMRKAADMGSPHAQFTVGKKLLNIEGEAIREKAVPLGVSMLECALSQDFSEAGYRLGTFYGVTGRPQEALRVLQKSGELGHSMSLWSLYSIFNDGEYGITKDAQRAVCYRKLSKEVDEDKTKKYPNLNKICPLPPTPMP